MAAERHEAQFRGVWIPAEVMMALGAGTLTPNDVLLLAIVDMFCKHGSGCWASNGFLAQRLGVSGEWVRRSVVKMEALGFLKRAYQGTSRFIRCAWELPPGMGATGVGGGATGVGGRGATGVGPEETRGNIQERSGGRRPHGGEAVVAGEDSSMPFFDDLPAPDKRTKPSDQDAANAASLRSLLASHKRLTGPYSAKAWANQFRLLRQQDQVPPERITAMLEWLGEHIADQYTPRVFSAADFRRRFAARVDACRRHTPIAADASDLDDDVYDVQDALGVTWPDNTKPADVLLAIDASLTGHDDLLAQLQKALKIARKEAREFKGSQKSRAEVRAGNLEELVSRLGSSETFVTNWLRQVNRMAFTWKPWKGQVLAFAFTRRHKRFQELLAKWGQAYGGDAGMFIDIVEGLQDG